ncbi:hypothetical protein ABPG72_018322 [Tetrahymena utriculariae]
MRPSLKSESIVQPANFPKISQQQYQQKTSSKQHIQSSPVVNNIEQAHAIKPLNLVSNPAVLYQMHSPTQMKQNQIQFGYNLQIASPQQQFKQAPFTYNQSTTVQQFLSPPQQFQTERATRIHTQPTKNLGKNDNFQQIDQISPTKQNLTTLSNNEQHQQTYYFQNMSNQKNNLSAQSLNTTNFNYSPQKQQQNNQQLQQQQQQLFQNTIIKQSPQTNSQLTAQILIKNNSQHQIQQQQQQILQKQQMNQLQTKQPQITAQNFMKQESQQQEVDAKMNSMDQKINMLVQEINSLQILIVKKSKEAKYWKQKYEAIDQNMASFLSDEEKGENLTPRRQLKNSDSVIEEEKDIENSEDYHKRDQHISKLKTKIKDLSQQLFDKDLYYKEQLDTITKIIKQKDEYLQQYISLNQELLDKIEVLSQQQTQFQQMKEDNEQLFQDLQNKQEIIDRLQKQLNIDDRTSLYNSQLKNYDEDVNQSMINKLKQEITIVQSDYQILQSQYKSLQAENENLQARVNTLLFAQTKGTLFSNDSPSVYDKPAFDRSSEIKKIQQQLSQYATIVQEIQNEEDLQESQGLQNQFNKQDLVDSYHSSQSNRDGQIKQQQILPSDFASQRNYSHLSNNIFAASSYNNSPQKDPILHQESI